MFSCARKIADWLAIPILLIPFMVHAAPAPDTVVSIDSDNVITRNYMGLGVQWDPNDVWDYTDAQWARVTQRVDFMRLPWIRCCLSANSYCHGFDAQGNPVYDWNSVPAKRLVRILDFCQTHHVDVMLGEWGPPFGMTWQDPRWSRIIGDCLEYLIRTRGYTCITYYNKVNEPQGDWPRYLTWLEGQESLRAELVKRGLADTVMLVGPDQSGGRSALQWVDYMLRRGASTFGAFEMHWYAGSSNEIPEGTVEKVLGEARKMVSRRDPAGRQKRCFIGEAGTAEWLDGKDSNRYIRDFEYGVYMSDYAAQTMRAGMHGLSAWMLDDPMHQQPGSFPPGGVPGGNPAVDFDFKVWGLWNSLGSAMGKPEDENLRPWFYTWSTMMRSFPNRANIVSTSYPHLKGLRATCALLPHGAKSDISILLVNDSLTPRKLLVTLPNAVDGAGLLEYRYFTADRPVDAGGYPKPDRVHKAVRLDRGVELSMPSRGVIILTTLNGGLPFLLTHGRTVPVSDIAIQQPESSVQPGESQQVKAITDPPGRAVRWSVRNSDGTTTDLAVIDRSGLLTGKKVGQVKVIAAAGSGANAVSGRIAFDITSLRRMVDPLDDFNRVYEHSGRWGFDTVHNNLFEGDPSRLKRNADTPEYLVYRFRNLGNFALKVYFTGALEDKYAVSASADGATWVPVPTVQESPVSTMWDWKRTVIRPSGQLSGMNYLRIEFRNDKVIWTPQLGEVTISASGPTRK